MPQSYFHIPFSRPYCYSHPPPPPPAPVPHPSSVQVPPPPSTPRPAPLSIPVPLSLSQPERERQLIGWRLLRAERIIKYTFKNRGLGMEALMMAAGDYGAKGTVIEGGWMYLVGKNTRLAVVGDRMIGAVLSARWFVRGGEKDQETQLRLLLTSNWSLHRRGKHLELDTCIVKNKGNEKDEVSETMMATTVEALLGAVYEDSLVDRLVNSLVQVERVMGQMGFFEGTVIAEKPGQYSTPVWEAYGKAAWNALQERGGGEEGSEPRKKKAKEEKKEESIQKDGADESAALVALSPFCAEGETVAQVEKEEENGLGFGVGMLFPSPTVSQSERRATPSHPPS